MTTQTTPHDIRHTAIHEAGHAVVCDELGVQWDQAVITEDGRSGLTGVEGDDGWWVPTEEDQNSEKNLRAFRAWGDEQATIDLAGQAAVVAILGNADMSDGSALNMEPAKTLKRHAIDSAIPHHQMDSSRQRRALWSLSRNAAMTSSRSPMRS